MARTVFDGRSAMQGCRRATAALLLAAALVSTLASGIEATASRRLLQSYFGYPYQTYSSSYGAGAYGYNGAYSKPYSYGYGYSAGSYSTPSRYAPYSYGYSSGYNSAYSSAYPATYGYTTPRRSLQQDPSSYGTETAAYPSSGYAGTYGTPGVSGYSYVLPYGSPAGYGYGYSLGPVYTAYYGSGYSTGGAYSSSYSSAASTTYPRRLQEIAYYPASGSEAGSYYSYASYGPYSYAGAYSYGGGYSTTPAGYGYAGYGYAAGAYSGEYGSAYSGSTIYYRRRSRLQEISYGAATPYTGSYSVSYYASPPASGPYTVAPAPYVKTIVPVYSTPAAPTPSYGPPTSTYYSAPSTYAYGYGRSRASAYGYGYSGAAGTYSYVTYLPSPPTYIPY